MNETLLVTRLHGRVAALEVSLCEIAKVSTDNLAALRNAAENIVKLAALLDSTGDESQAMLAAGMREHLQAVADSL